MIRTNAKLGPVRMLPEEVANKIAAGEVVERPASVVKELIENALDAGATRITVRLVAAGRRTIEVIDNGAGMSEQDVLLAIERHTTSKIRTSEDLDEIRTFGFRGEALASIAAVSRFELVARRAQDEAATRVQVEGGILRQVDHAPAPVGARVSAHRLYFNTPVRAKFLKGITTELSRCIDCVQRFVLSADGVAFQLSHNDKVLLDVPENASLRDRVALIWGLSFVEDLVELHGERECMRFRGLIGTPRLTRSSRSHQFFFLNGRPVANRALQYGFEDGYHQLLTIGRRPVGIVMIEAPPRSVDINIHPAKREVRFRDERAVQSAMREVVRECLSALRAPEKPAAPIVADYAVPPAPLLDDAQSAPMDAPRATHPPLPHASPPAYTAIGEETSTQPPAATIGVQTEFAGETNMEDGSGRIIPEAFYRPVESVGGAPVQLFDTYLLVPEEERLLIIDQHALHERLTYDSLYAELSDREYESQQLIVPLVVDVPPSYVRLLETNIALFSKLGIEIEPFGGHSFQVTAICPLYEDARIPDTICRVLDHLAQGDLFSKEEIMDELLRLAVEACRGSVKAGDRLTIEERQGLLDGFRRLRPPYTCPHGRPIIIELTQAQMEKSFRRKQ